MPALGGGAAANRPPITLLDGSVGHTLKQTGAIPAESTFLAVADLAASGDPSALTALAAQYAAAGCTVLTVPNFGVTPASLARAGRADSDLEPLTSACVDAVRRARPPGTTTLLAGCLPPLGPDCYAPAPPGVAATSRAVYARIAGVLLAGGVDLLLAETASSSADAAAALAGAADAVAAAAEATASTAAAARLSLPLWIAWTLDDDAWPPSLRGGEYLADAAASLSAAEARAQAATAAAAAAAAAAVREAGGGGGAGGSDGGGEAPPPSPAVAVTAHLVNCCSPGAVAAGIAVLRNVLPPGVAVGGYANGFATPTSAWLRRGHGAGGAGAEEGSGGADAAGPSYGPDDLITPSAYAAAVEEWVTAGATIVGGCCGVGVEHLRAVRGRRVVGEK